MMNIVFFICGAFVFSVGTYFFLKRKCDKMAREGFEFGERLKNSNLELEKQREVILVRERELEEIRERNLSIERENANLGAGNRSLQEKLDTQQMEIRNNNEKSLENSTLIQRKWDAAILVKDRELEGFREKNLSIERENANFGANNRALQEKLESQKLEMQRMNEKSLLEFEKLANKIFEEKSEKFSKVNKENIAGILDPLGKKLQEFKGQIDEVYQKESKERFSLQSEVKNLMELNKQISDDAVNLTNALKGNNKAQGNWGEMILENILEYSGLQKDREYFLQASFKDEDGKLKQPDILVKYPGDRNLIIDAKVSLIAYERFSSTESKEEQKIYIAELVRSVKGHIDNLSSKEYEKFDKSLDFVMLFIPIEPAFLLALQHDQSLWNYAYKKRVIIISPTNLVAALKMVSDLWSREYKNKNAQKIAERGVLIHKKLVSFFDDMQNIKIGLDRANKEYDSAMNKLEGKGNLFKQAKELENLGISNKKNVERGELEEVV